MRPDLRPQGCRGIRDAEVRHKLGSQFARLVLLSEKDDKFRSGRPADSLHHAAEGHPVFVRYQKFCNVFRREMDSQPAVVNLQAEKQVGECSLTFFRLQVQQLPEIQHEKLFLLPDAVLIQKMQHRVPVIVAEINGIFGLAVSVIFLFIITLRGFGFFRKNKGKILKTLIKEQGDVSLFFKGAEHRGNVFLVPDPDQELFHQRLQDQRCAQAVLFLPLHEKVGIHPLIQRQRNRLLRTAPNGDPGRKRIQETDSRRTLGDIILQEAVDALIAPVDLHSQGQENCQKLRPVQIEGFLKRTDAKFTAECFCGFRPLGDIIESLIRTCGQNRIPDVPLPVIGRHVEVSGHFRFRYDQTAGEKFACAAHPLEFEISFQHHVQQAQIILQLLAGGIIRLVSQRQIEIFMKLVHNRYFSPLTDIRTAQQMNYNMVWREDVPTLPKLSDFAL